MTAFARRPLFWVAFAALSALAGLFAWRYFPDALPLVNLDVRMSRVEALTRAADLAQRLKLAPADARAAVMFGHDGATQNFVELEAGGNARFTALLADKNYSPYWWDVRLFKARETAEARIRFRPDGAPYGFALKLPENQPGAALDEAAARAVAEERARVDWGIDLSPFKLLEHAQERLPIGRVDHAFVYERSADTLGDGRFRMRLGVSGDMLTELQHYVFVPQAFERRFQEMRAANNAIARVASLAAGLLYGLGGCVLGALWLLRKRALLWRPALVAGTVVAGINALAILANAPQAWFGFDTAQSEWVFWGQQVGVAVLVLIGGALGLALVFMAAESLSRLAFGDQPQLWKLWTRDAAPTPSILGRTLGGYLFVPLELALIVTFYFITNRYLGWWQPSESLSDPNILGSAVPGLAPIGMALQAGFMEECLFRAVPLSLAALIGAHFGQRRLLIGIALVLLAVVIGAAHANYPGFPAYSRLVELIGPAFIWGLIFLRFGLLPTIVLHALFDLVLMSLPVFLVDGSVARANQALVIAAALVPLGVVLFRRVQLGRWHELPEILRNRGWAALVQVASANVASTHAAAGAWSSRMEKALPVLALAGVLAIVFFGDYKSDAPALVIDRTHAEALADAALKEHGTILGPEWSRMSATRLAGEDPDAWLWHKFVWREGGADTYARLMGTWLAPPLWEVRYARLAGGDVADRAEEWRVIVDGRGNVRQVRHALPEARPGAKLAQEEARVLAREAVRKLYGLDPTALREVSAEEKERPARSDWRFTFTDPRVDAGKTGEARVLVNVSGNEVTSAGRYIFVPEEWQRTERERASRMRIAKMGVGLAAALFAIAALIAAIMAWSRGRFDRRAFWLASSLVAAASLVTGVNLWPAFAMRLSTTEPYLWQVLLWAGGLGLSLLMQTLLVGLLAGVAAWMVRSHVSDGVAARTLWWRGVQAGLFAVGVKVLAGAVAMRDVPHWPGVGEDNAWVPWLAALTSPTVVVLAGTAVAAFVLYWLNRLTDGWQRRRGLTFALLVVVAAAQAALRADDWLEIVFAGVAVGALNTLLFATVLRFDLRAVPGFVGAEIAAAVVAEAVLERTASAAWHAVLQLGVALALTWAITRYLVRAGAPTVAATPANPLPIAAD
ncbi:MAG: CPBP family intramembrane glutamic endopeptidase [Casimicrobiaceae bacterium]